MKLNSMFSERPLALLAFVPFGFEEGGFVLRASEIQDDVAARHKKIFFATTILSSKRELVQIGDYSAPYQQPEMARRNPEGVSLTQNSC